jgi:hypothetical protein
MSIYNPLVFFQGEDIQCNCTVVPSPIDITGWTIAATVTDRPGGSVLASTASSPATIAVTITNAPMGQFQVSIPRLTTLTFPVGDQYWEVRRVDNGGNAVLTNGNVAVQRSASTGD